MIYINIKFLYNKLSFLQQLAEGSASQGFVSSLGFDCSCLLGSDRLVIERSRIRVPAGVMGEFYSPGSTFCADSYFGISFIPVLPQ